MNTISTAIRRLLGGDEPAGAGPIQATWNDTVIASSEHRHPTAAWYYPDPSRAAEKIRNHVAFGPGVKVQRVAHS